MMHSLYDDDDNGDADRDGMVSEVSDAVYQSLFALAAIPCYSSAWPCNGYLAYSIMIFRVCVNVFRFFV